MLVAPHAARRDTVRHPWRAGGVRVNDLYTADVALELAERFDGDAIVNAALDRNDVDLNRLRQVLRHGRWFLEALAARVETLVERHGELLVLFVHGWNVVNPICDCGVGSAPPPGDGWAMPAVPVDVTGTVDARFLDGRLRALRTACAASGIATVCGWRYPASHPENLLQLFTGRYRAHGDPLLAGLARLGEVVNAVQLELSISLRWPGPWRERFADAAVATLGSREPHPLRTVSDAPAAARTPDAIQPGGPVALQFHDRVTGLAGVAALEPGGRRASRLLIVPPDGQVHLYTGELPAEPPSEATEPMRPEHGSSPAPTVARTADGCLELTYDGPMVRFSNTTPFLDLEAGLREATLVRGVVALRFTPAVAADDTARPTMHDHGDEKRPSRRSGPAMKERTPADTGAAAAPTPTAFGRGFAMVSGRVCLAPASQDTLADEPTRAEAWDGAASLDGPGFVDHVLFGGRRLAATVSEGALGALRIVVPARGIDGARCWSSDPLTELSVGAARVLGRDRDAPGPLAEIVVSGTDGRSARIVCDAVHRIPVVRQGRAGKVAEHVLAFCRFRLDDRPAGQGWIEAML